MKTNREWFYRPIQRRLEVKVPDSKDHISIYFTGKIHRVELWPDDGGSTSSKNCEDVLEEIVE